MQRIAICASVLAIALGGCAKNVDVRDRSLPDPLINTRSAPRDRIPPHVRLRPPPPPPQAPPRAATPQYSGNGFTQSDLTPPGGIQRAKWSVIVVHHSATPMDTPESMDRYHRTVRKWENGLGYHFVIGNGVNTEDGKIYVGPRWKSQMTGAHCRASSGSYFGTWRANNYFNEHGVGICLIGNFEATSPTPKQIAALKQLTRMVCDSAGINPAYVYGHGSVTHKTACPGRYLEAKLASIRSATADALAVELNQGPPPGWPLGLDQDFAAPAYDHLHHAIAIAHPGVELGYVAYRAAFDALDYVTYAYASARGAAGGCDIHDHHAENTVTDAHAIAYVRGEVREPHAAP